MESLLQETFSKERLIPATQIDAYNICTAGHSIDLGRTRRSTLEAFVFWQSDQLYAPSPFTLHHRVALYLTLCDKDAGIYIEKTKTTETMVLKYLLSCVNFCQMLWLLFHIIFTRHNFVSSA